jgi:hypothetical protein
VQLTMTQRHLFTAIKTIAEDLRLKQTMRLQRNSGTGLKPHDVFMSVSVANDFLH